MKPRAMTVPFPGVLALCNIAQLFGIGCRNPSIFVTFEPNRPWYLRGECSRNLRRRNTSRYPVSRRYFRGGTASDHAGDTLVC